MVQVGNSTTRARKDDEDPYVMYIVVRESLGMTPGKLGAQIGHAVQIAVNHFYDLKEMAAWDSDESPELLARWHTWTSGAFRKVLLKADDKEWEKVKSQAKTYFLVRDAGLTQVPAGSETCLALWPMKKSERPKALKKLQVLP